MSFSLLDSLFPAEWRGVPFHMPDAREETGRRVVRFLFPGRDDGWHEDMGALDGAIRVTGLIIGEDYVRRAERMRAAFRAPGPGLLVHPWLGELDVVLADTAEISFTEREIRLARFTAIFEPYIERPVPKLDTLGLLFATLDGLREDATRLLRWALAPVRLTQALIGTTGAFATEMVGLLRGGIAVVRGLGGLPRTLETSFGALLDLGGLRADAGYGGAVAARLAAPGAIIRDAGTPRLAPAVGLFGGAQTAPLVETGAAARLLLGVAALLRATPAGTPALRLAAAALLLADAVQLGVQVRFASRNEALAQRATLDAALVALATEAAFAAATDPANAGTLWRALAGTRAAVARDLSERAGRLPEVRTLLLPAAAPTWLVAQHLAGDAPGRVAAQYLDLVARNRRRASPAGERQRPARLPAGPVELLA
jgi:prophage DNA circulation protein